MPVYIAFDDTTLEANPTWTRIDGGNVLDAGYRVSRWTVSRGRTSELEKTGAGEATVEIADWTGAFDPTYSGATFANKLDPMKQAKITLINPVTSEEETIFRGFVGEWNYEMDISERLLRITIDLTDAFDLLASLAMTPGNVGNTVPPASLGDIYFADDPNLDAVQTRIQTALTDFGWPLSLATIFTGNVGLQGTVYARLDDGLSVLSDAGDAEFPGGVSNCYVNKEGVITFHGRFARFDPDNPQYGITEWIAGDHQAVDGGTGALISGLSFSRGRDKIINAAVALPMGAIDEDAVDALVKDDSSIAIYGWRSVNFENLLTRNGDGGTTAVEETAKFAQYYVDNYATPRTRVDRLMFRTQDVSKAYAQQQWDLLCNIDISDRIHLVTTHDWGGGFSDDFFVEGVHYECTPLQPDMDNVTLEVDVSPAAYYVINPF